MKEIIKIEFECLCNLDCDYCFCKDEKYETPVEDVYNKMNKVFEIYSPENTYFRVEGVGEITLYPQIVDYLTEKAREGYSIEVLTNGMLTKVIEQNLHLKWIVSLDGHTVMMNKFRKLKENQISKMLDVVVANNFEIQCVHADQTLEEMNDFINYLRSRNYNGFLHIFPRKYPNKRNTNYLEYDKLVKADFIAEKDYFDRWKYICENKKRNFTCDFLKYGYVYRIMHDEEKIRKIKCDCGAFMVEEEKCKKYSELNCNTCINNFEYDMSRRVKANMLLNVLD